MFQGLHLVSSLFYFTCVLATCLNLSVVGASRAYFKECPLAFLTPMKCLLFLVTPRGWGFILFSTFQYRSQNTSQKDIIHTQCARGGNLHTSQYHSCPGVDWLDLCCKSAPLAPPTNTNNSLTDHIHTQGVWSGTELSTCCTCGQMV